MKKLVFLFFPLLLNCAYFDSGSTTKIKFEITEKETVRVNNLSLDSNHTEIEIHNNKPYTYEIRKDGSLIRRGAINREVNGKIFLSSIIWPYVFVDLTLGSNYRVINGYDYKVIGYGEELMNEDERKAKSSLIFAINSSWMCFLAGSMLAMAGGAYQEAGGRNLAIQIPLSVGGFAGLVGAGFSVYKISNEVKRINIAKNKRTN